MVAFTDLYSPPCLPPTSLRYVSIPQFCASDRRLDRRCASLNPIKNDFIGCFRRFWPTRTLRLGT